MANPEHVEIVRQGAEAIEEWWETRRLPLAPDELLDLTGADLRGIWLMEANLQGANLRGTRLSDSILNRTILANASLCGADLRRASLIQTGFINADLNDADLRESDLARAGFSGTLLCHAKMSSARLFETTFGDVDLHGIEDLDLVEHAGPSSIDERTLRKSWPLPEVFLRGAGLSDDLIAFCRATFGKAIEFYSCFISYSSKDDEFAKRLYADLQDKGVRCWFAPEDLRIGDKFRLRIDEAIRLHDKLLLILSEPSVNSPWVEDEVEAAFEKERKAKERGEDRAVLFPIRLDDAVMESDTAWAASIRRTRHIGDFRRWKEHDAYQQAFERLMRDLKSGSSSSTDKGTD